ncbi:MAG: AsnC family protein [Candidatus Bathyarchaeota archaeon]|nr:AsnC family protein [Candidatus Bathyarchaeota archaeon]MDH5686946.1 AsnC family protein [Candidatus Bathyarchaeota archaeon]
MGQVTDRDAEMVSLLIRDPSLSLDELGAKLGVTKQAVAERKRRLEEEGFTKSFYFWNVSPRRTRFVHSNIEVGKGHEQANRISLILDRYNPVVVFFRTEPEESFEGKAASISETISEVEGILLFNNEEEEKQLRAELEQIGIRDVSIEFVLFSRLLGEKCDVTLKTPEQVEDIARDVAQHLSSEASVHAVLYERHERPVDQFDLIVIRDERFQPKTDSYERRIKETLLDYHFTNLRWFMSSKDKWLKNMKIIYARDETLRKRMERKIDSIKS